MQKTASLNIRLNPKTKSDAEALFANFGITITDAISMFLNQSLLVGGLPFSVRLPSFSAETFAAMREAKAIASGEIPAKTYNSARELFEELENEC